MQHSKFVTRIALSVAAALTAVGAVHGQEPATAAKTQQPSIYDTWPKADPNASRREADKGVQQLREAKRLSQILGKPLNPMYDKDGNFVKDITPRIDGPAVYEDENGHKMTAWQKAEREAVHKRAFAILKSQGYSWKEHQKRLEEKKKEPDEWAVKAAETERWIKEHGPITTKVFVRPGLTPEQSAALDRPGNAYKMINGKWVVVDGKTKRPVLENMPKASGEIKRARQARPLVSVTTKLTKRPARSSDMAAFKQQTTYDKPFTPELVNDIASGKYDDKPNLTAEEVQKLFPDMNLRELETKGTVHSYEAIRINDDADGAAGKIQAPGSTANPSAKSGKPVSFLEKISEPVAMMLGIGSAHAQTQTQVQISSTGQRQEQGANAYSQDDLSTLLGIDENKHWQDKSGEYAKYAQELDEQARDIQKAVGKKMTEDPEGAQKYLDKMFEADSEGVDVVKTDERTEQAAQFAADIVHATGSLTMDEFNEDVELLTNMLTDKRTGSALISELRRILKNHPEIYTIEPDADAALDKLAYEQFGIGVPPAEDKSETTYVFLSRSLGLKAIQDLMERASMAARHDLVFVFRGVPEGVTINDGILEIQKLGQNLRPMPNIVIDPALFRRYAVTAVPTVVRAKGRSVVAETLAMSEGSTGTQGTPGTDGKMPSRKFGNLIAKVEGLNNDEWLLDRIEMGQTGDLGVQGEVAEISEPDLIEVMKKKFMEVNWEEKKRLAIKNAWKHQNFIDLPMAAKARTRIVDPTILVEKDMLDLAGRPIRKAGDRVNPLAIQPFTLTLVVFDPLREDEMKRVGRFLSRQKLMGKPKPVLIATRIDKEEGWESYKRLTDRLDEHVFVLNTDVQERFEIQATPSVVTADNAKQVFVVEELGPLEDDLPGAKSKED